MSVNIIHFSRIWKVQRCLIGRCSADLSTPLCGASHFLEYVWSPSISCEPHFSPYPPLILSWRPLRHSPPILRGLYFACFLYALFNIFLHRLRVRHRQLSQTIRLSFPPGTWNPRDLPSVVAHISAFPPALRLTQRNDSHPSVLARSIRETTATFFMNEYSHCSAPESSAHAILRPSHEGSPTPA